ncbi:unnamed protein product [Meloidogyne enterolobii]|uniref:Uncharacterized protein n=2 Tax=Meloidogyne enterolobii TaxID=390850 RepID=A0A6V7X9E4_MELEN|nr:unnamed protein product [Meloidogyne enterolobii]
MLLPLIASFILREGIKKKETGNANWERNCEGYLYKCEWYKARGEYVGNGGGNGQNRMNDGWMSLLPTIFSTFNAFLQF